MIWLWYDIWRKHIPAKYAFNRNIIEAKSAFISYMGYFQKNVGYFF